MMRQPRLGDGVDPVGIDDRRAIQPNGLVIN